MEQLRQMSSQGRVPVHKPKKCDKACLINKIMESSMTKSVFIDIVDGLTHTLLFDSEKEPEEKDMIALRKHLHKETVQKLLDLLKLTQPDFTPIVANETLLRGNKFPQIIIDVVTQKQYDPKDLASIISQMHKQDMNYRAIIHAFAHLSPEEMFTLMHHKADLVHILNCKYNNGCVTLHDIKDRLI